MSDYRSRVCLVRKGNKVFQVVNSKDEVLYQNLDWSYAYENMESMMIVAELAAERNEISEEDIPSLRLVHSVVEEWEI